MKDVIYNLFENSMNLSFEQICLNIIVSAVLGFLIFVSYMISHAGTVYSKKFNASLVILATLTGTVMTVIGFRITAWKQYRPFSRHGWCAFYCKIQDSYQGFKRYSLYFLGNYCRYLFRCWRLYCSACRLSRNLCGHPYIWTYQE